MGREDGSENLYRILEHLLLGTVGRKEAAEAADLFLEAYESPAAVH